MRIKQEAQMIAKKPEERFGLIAVDKGFLALEKLIEAMKIQLIGDVRRFKYRLIGEILIDIGALNVSQVAEVLNVMNNRGTIKP
jgi:hypothetical protein